MTDVRRVRGCLFGLAFGDALAAPTEFLSVSEILRKFPPDGPQELGGRPARVTDDTQMMLEVGEALVEAPRPFTAATLEPILRRNFVRWANSPDNNRAPGNTCMTACANLERKMPWIEASVKGSKGCGANMRVAPVGLLTLGKDGLTAPDRAAIAQFQAALTHGHPTALAVTDLTAYAVAVLAEGQHPEGLPQLLREYANSQMEVYHADWLGNLWQRPGVGSPQEFIRRGWQECLTVLDRLDAALVTPDYATDPCLQTGAGWAADEAFATAMLCFLLYPDDPVAAVRRAAVTSGDSDSIACLAGSFAGARWGMEKWPPAWAVQIEYRERLEDLAATLKKL